MSLYRFLFIVLVVSALAGNLVWFSVDNSIRGVDSQNHLFFSVDFFYQLKHLMQGTSSPFWLKVGQFFQLFGRPVALASLYWPNGLNLTAAFFYAIAGTSLFSAKLAMLPYLAILLYATFSLGAFLFSEGIGLLAAWLVFMYPIVFESSRQFQLDFPLTAMVALSMLFLFKSNGLRNRRYCLLLGISWGYAMLIKGQVMFFLLAPFLAVVFAEIKQLRARFFSSEQGANVALILACVLSLSSFWWMQDIKKLQSFLFEHILSPVKSMENSLPLSEKYSFRTLMFYPFALFYSSLRPVLATVFLAVLPFFWRQRHPSRKLFALWIVVPLVIFGLVLSIKHSRFLMPVLPAIALMTAQGIAGLSKKKMGTALLSATLAFTIVQFFVLSFSAAIQDRDQLERFYLFGSDWGFGADYQLFAPPQKLELQIQEVAGLIDRNLPSTDGPVTIAWISCVPYRPDSFETMFWLKVHDERFSCYALTTSFKEWQKQIDSFDFFILYAGAKDAFRWPAGEEFMRRFNEHAGAQAVLYKLMYKEKWDELLRKIAQKEKNYRLVGTVKNYFFPDTYVYYVYRRLESEKTK